MYPSTTRRATLRLRSGQEKKKLLTGEREDTHPLLEGKTRQEQEQAWLSHAHSTFIIEKPPTKENAPSEAAQPLEA
ncbi:MAG: hypothetical protein A3A27_01090 [Candidatus Wildermuthbacteria bacterium RIFCSPLOWO2_01_FULL_47_18]|uniref:Uncharacterized protein n=2 Tax=Candidatus Wildermuthiibacteriota TaxID=1817923 RepID=A0A1G2RJQ5_9BACT|nr:MAG: hypothetical protein A3J68_01810 [Candidatus Wildermuthbacteria bacterium RIFCSPHIGHO2_02_FULL_48_16]OHA72599.1 MAG: hypothetical protein A3A27_01090 [Candidatus Wildermuthbacteria bacterium RIFCSPLOWO2_01_FULL_47_18]